jgi:hypothetical protein
VVLLLVFLFCTLLHRSVQNVLSIKHLIDTKTYLIRQRKRLGLDAEFRFTFSSGRQAIGLTYCVNDEAYML